MKEKISYKEIVLSIVVSFAAYWFANAVLWIPWKANQWLGIVIMILLVPTLWGFSSFYCLSRISLLNMKKAVIIIASVFLIIAFISDYFFFAIWRGIPDELYHPTTFAAYGLIVIMPVIIGILLKRKNVKPKTISNKELIITGGLGILFLTSTLYSVQYW
ncbi:MAG TPA: hypothetical protein DEQ02_06850 [Ruminococcaceae bacterium]|nr:hypothetical protein [Oscillospiraceae bacterium]